MKLRWFALFFPIRLALAALLILLAWHAWVFFRPRPAPLGTAELGAARNAARAAAQTIRETAPAGAMRIGVAHLANDPTDAVTELLKTELRRLPGTTVEDHSPIQRFLGDVSRAIREATSLDELLHAARRVDLDVVVGGRVLQTEALDPGQGKALLQVLAYDCRTGGWLTRDTFAGTWQPGLGERVSDRVLGMGRIARLLFWVGVVVALPWATFWGTRWALERRSNLASFLVILAYTGAGLLLAVALSGFALKGGADWGRFFGAFLFCALYNYWACERIALKTE